MNSSTLSISGTLPADKMKAVRITQDHRIEVAFTQIPIPAADEILLKPAAAGICGTDLHILLHGFAGTRYPVIPIHEFCGHVVQTGANVQDFRTGDFVTVDPNVVSGESRWCRAGRPNLCPSLTPIGVARPGAAAEYVAVPATSAFVIDEKLGHDVAAMVEPLACALHAVAQAQSVAGSNILILGGGTMGLMIAIAARTAGARHITLVDLSPEKLAIARDVGVDAAMLPQALGKQVFDVVFEATGAAPALNQALACLEKTATLVQVGVHDAHTTIPFNPLLLFENEWRLIGSNSCADQFPAAVALMPEIADKVKLLVGETFPVWEFERAIAHMRSGKSVKTMLRF